jgi:integrase
LKATIPPFAHHLTRKRNGIYYWRRRVPKAERGAEVALSLRMRNYREAEHLAAVADAAYEEAFMVTPISNVPSRLGWLAARLTTGTTAAEMAAELEESVRVTLERGKYLQEQRAIREGALNAIERDRALQKARDADRALAFLAETSPLAGIRQPAAPAEATPEIMENLDDSLINQKPQAPPSAGALHTDCLIVANPAPATVAPQVPVTPLSEPTKQRLMSSFEEEYFADREVVKGARQQVMGQDRRTIEMFRAMRGDKPFEEYRRFDITKFITVVRKLPRLHGKSPHYRDRPVPEIIAEADRRNDKRRLSERTVQRHISALTQFFRYAVDKGQIANTDRINLLDGFSFRLEKGAREQREAWTNADLILLFTSPLYMGCHKERRWLNGPHIVRDAKFWIPLLSLYLGARLEEFADLHRRDIQCDEGGTWFMDIRPWEEEGGNRRSLKTHAAKRKVPIHPELLRMGFLKYVEHRAPQADCPLFPELPRQGTDGKRGPALTRWFGRYRKAIGAYREGVAFHSFRHNAETRLNAVNADRRHVDYMFGHEPGGSEGRRRYDKGPSPSESVHTLALLRYPELDFSRLYQT